MDRLTKQFLDAGFDDEMLRTVAGWPDDEMNDILGYLSGEGVLGIAQRFIVKKGLVKLRAEMAV